MTTFQYIGCVLFCLFVILILLLARREKRCQCGPECHSSNPAALEAQRKRNLNLELDWLPRSKETDPKNWTPKREARLQELRGMKERGEI